MKRNILLDIANTLCQMLYSRRLTGDRELLLSLPAGIVSVDLLSGEARHDSAGQLAVEFGSQFADWLQQQIHAGSAPAVDAAVLIINIDPNLPHPTDFLGPFDRWSARCEIISKDRTYIADLPELGTFRPMF